MQSACLSAELDVTFANCVCCPQLAQRDGAAAVLVAAKEQQSAQIAKLTALLRTADGVRVHLPPRAPSSNVNLQPC